MSRKKKQRIVNKPQSTNERIATVDGFLNFPSRLGIGTNNQTSGATYFPNLISRNRLLLESAYRSSWLVGAAVDSVADDMTRKGVTITTQLEATRKSQLETCWEDLYLWDSLNSIIKWSRLYGGAVGVLLIDGQDPSTQLRVNTIGRGAFKGVLVLDRWLLNQTISEIITDLGPDMGKPKFYEVTAAAQGIPTWKIHHSRIIRMEGQELPFQQAYTENGWGQSVVERLWDRLLAFDSGTTGAAQLVNKAHLRTVRIDKLRQILAEGGAMEKALLKNMEMIRLMQSIEGLTLLDNKDEFDTTSYTFSGLSDVLIQFGQQVSGALGIPLVRLFGQSPAGFSTGDTDLSNYYDNINTQQERRLRRPLRRLFDIVHRSLFGEPLPDEFDFEFNPLWQMSDTDRSTVANNTVTALNGAVDGGLMPLHAAMSDLKNTSRVTGIGGNLTDEDIEDAKDQPPPDLRESDDLDEDTLPTGTDGLRKPVEESR